MCLGIRCGILLCIHKHKHLGATSAPELFNKHSEVSCHSLGHCKSLLMHLLHSNIESGTRALVSCLLQNNLQLRIQRKDLKHFCLLSCSTPVSQRGRNATEGKLLARTEEAAAAAKQCAGASEAGGKMLILVVCGGRGPEAGNLLVCSQGLLMASKVAQLQHWQRLATASGKALSTSTLPVTLRVSDKSAKKQEVVTAL